MTAACDRRETESNADAELIFRPVTTAALAQANGFFAPTPIVNVSAPSESTPEELAARCQAGNPEAFEQLVALFEARIFNFLHQFTPNRQDAEDLTQMTFVKAYQSLPRYRPSLAFAPWLFTIARRTAASHYWSLVRFEKLPAEEEVVEATPADLLARKEDQGALWRLARGLKPKQWEALWLRYGEDFSIAEIARILRTNQIYVKVLLHRARAGLAKLLADHPSFDPPRGIQQATSRTSGKALL